MRIISKFRDYYDSIQAYGQDENVVYVRKNEQIYDSIDDVLNEYYLRKTDYMGRPSEYFGNCYRNSYRGVDLVGTFSIFFCGERFNVIRTGYRKKERAIDIHNINGVYEEKLHYSKEGLDEYIDSLKIQQPRIAYYEKESTKRMSADIVEFFGLTKTSPDLHFKFNTPVFVITKLSTKQDPFFKYHRTMTATGVDVNPVLKDLDFMKVKDPYTAYQELDMFISGVMGGRSPVMVDVSDEDMKVKKGFGHHYAFKKEPTKHK